MSEKDNSKIDNDSIAITPLSKNVSWVDFLQNDAYMLFPEKDDWRKRFCFTMLTWAERKDSLEIADFVFLMKMDREQLYRWAKQYPDVKRAYDLAKLMLAVRKRKGALIRKYDKDVVYKDMHILDPEYLAINKYWSDLKKEEASQSEVRYVYLEKPKVKSKEEVDAERNADGAVIVKE